MEISVTRHAAVRMQQRAIPTEVIEFLRDFGATARCGGADSFFFDRKGRRRLAAAIGHARLCRAEKYLNSYAVLSDDGCVITAARRTRRMQRA